MIVIDGKEYEDIPENPPKWMIGEYQDGKRTKVRYVWIERYEREPTGGWGWGSFMLTLTNYGSVAIDGKPVRGEEDVKKVKEIFGRIK